MTTRAVILATGASLTKADVDLLRNLDRVVYAVNDAYRLCPWAEYLYACDCEWWDTHATAVATFSGERWTTSDDAAAKHGLKHMPGKHADTARRYFDASGLGIVYGGNSGFQALNLAYCHGVRDAVLLGFDMGGSHFFGAHPAAISKPSPFHLWLRHFERAAPEIKAAGMKVVNATRGGALNCFPRVELEAVT